MDNSSSSACEHWRRIIHRQQRSGLSVVQFCRQEHVAPSSFFAWKRRLAGESRAGASGPWPFVRVRPVAEVPPAEAPATSATAAPSAAPPLELHLPRGHRLLLRPGFDAPTLAAVLAILDQGQEQR